jgi:hypothetical protein
MLTRVKINILFTRTRIENVVVEKLLDLRQETVLVQQVSVGAVLDARVDPAVADADTLQVEHRVAALGVAFNNARTLSLTVPGKYYTEAQQFDHYSQ